MRQECRRRCNSDCASATNSSFCEGDYFAPNTITATTTISANTQKNIIDTLLIQIKDKSSYKGDYFLKMSSDYSTFVCLGSCTSGHPFAAYTKGRK